MTTLTAETTIETLTPEEMKQISGGHQGFLGVFPGRGQFPGQGEGNQGQFPGHYPGYGQFPGVGQFPGQGQGNQGQFPGFPRGP